MLLQACAGRRRCRCTECRLEHPLKLASVAGALRPAQGAGRPIRAPRGRRSICSSRSCPPLNRRAAGGAPVPARGRPRAGGQRSVRELRRAPSPASTAITTSCFVDQRGTGNSAPLICNYPDDWRDTADELPAARQATLGLPRRYGERVRFYTTSVAVQDLERVRAALGYASDRSVRLLLRHARGRALHAAPSGRDPRRDARRRHLSRADDRSRYAARRRARPRSHRRPLRRGSPIAPRPIPDLRARTRALAQRFGPELPLVLVADPTSGAPLDARIQPQHVLPRRCASCRTTPREASLLPTLIHEAAAGRSRRSRRRPS